MAMLGLIAAIVVLGSILYALYVAIRTAPDRPDDMALSDNPMIWDNMSPEARKRVRQRARRKGISEDESLAIYLRHGGGRRRR